MRAVLFDGRSVRVAERDAPRLVGGDALIRVERAGICSTDLQILAGYMGFQGVLGHEVVGRVVEGPRELLGERVVCEINFACGACAACRAGLGRHCPTRTVMGIAGADGAMAELVRAPVANLHVVPEGLSPEVAVFAEPLAAAYAIVEQELDPAAGRRPFDEALVLGDGKLGLLIALALADAGLAVRLVGRHPDKLAKVASERIRTSLEAEPQPRARLVVEATGTEQGLARAIACTEPRGTLVLKSTVATPSTLHLAPIVIHELRVTGSRCGPFGPALAALAERRIDPSPLVSATLPLDEAPRALELAAERSVLKVLLAP